MPVYPVLHRRAGTNRNHTQKKERQKHVKPLCSLNKRANTSICAARESTFMNIFQMLLQYPNKKNMVQDSTMSSPKLMPSTRYPLLCLLLEASLLGISVSSACKNNLILKYTSNSACSIDRSFNLVSILAYDCSTVQ
jgi:hypothetical protein